MKRILTLALAVILTLSLAACGGKGDSSESTPAASEVTLVKKEANFTSLLVPSDFGEFSDVDGYGVAKGENASIVINPTTIPDVRLEDVTEDYLASLMGDTYSNIKTVSFDNPVTIAGVDALSYVSTCDSNSTGVNYTVCIITMFFSIDGQDCEQQIIFTYATGANTSLEANMTEIINSITL